MRVAFLPSAAALAGNPYWTILKNGLEAAGVEYVSPDGPLLRWLWRTRNQPAILHLHYVQQFYAYELHYARLRWVLRMARNLRLARLWGHRVVFTLHNLTPTYPLRPEWVDRLGHRLAIGLADAVIVHCETARGLLAETYGRRRNVHTVTHPHFIGIYPDTVTREAARARFGFGPEQRVLAFIGGIRPNKGLDRLVRAFKQCDDPEMRLVIAGKPGPPEAHVEAIRAAVAEDSRIQLHFGFIPDEELQCYYRAADVVVLPFARILTSSSTMLAMSFGRAVIVPRMGCLQELPDDVALHYEHDSDKGLIDTIVCSGEIDLGKMGAAALAHVSLYSQERFIRSTIKVYSE